MADRFQNGPMAPRPKQDPPPAFIAEWLDFLDVRPVVLVKAGIISEAYLSHLRSRKRTNPSIATLRLIGDFLGIDWADLYRPPPTSDPDDFRSKTRARITRRTQ